MNANIAREKNRAAELSWYFSKFERFCALLDILDKSGRKAPFRLNEIQRAFLGSMSQRDVVLKPRQIGMTTLLLALAVYYFVTIRGASVVIVCQSMTGNGPLGNLSATLRRFFASLRKAGIALDFAVEKGNEWALRGRDSTLRVVVAGASEASAAKVGRSGTVTHLICTETAFWEYAEDTTNALFECVPSIEHGSHIISESTPNGAAGLFYRQCRSAMARESAYKFHFFPWFQSPGYATQLEQGETLQPTEEELPMVALGVTPEQLKWYRHKVADKGRDQTKQEYPSDPETCFLVSGRGFFEADVTARLLALATEPIETRDHGRIRIWRKLESGKIYLLATDTSEGGGGDPSGGVLKDRATGEHCATISGQYPPWELAKVSAALAKEYNDALIAVERNNHGHAVLQALEREEKYRKIYKHDDEKLGWPTNPVTRPQMLDELEDAHRRGLWKSPDLRVLSQFRTFVITATGKAEAAAGEHDDLVIAEAIAWAVRQKPRGAVRGSVSGDLAAVL